MRFAYSFRAGKFDPADLQNGEFETGEPEFEDMTFDLGANEADKKAMGLPEPLFAGAAECTSVSRPAISTWSWRFLCSSFSCSSRGQSSWVEARCRGVQTVCAKGVGVRWVIN